MMSLAMTDHYFSKNDLELMGNKIASGKHLQLQLDDKLKEMLRSSLQESGLLNQKARSP